MEEAGIPPAALRVEDPELDPLPRWTCPVAGDDHLGPLADDIPAEADPGPSSKFQAKTGRLGDGGRDPAGQPRRLEDHEQDVRPAGERSEPSEPIRDRGWTPAIAPGPARTGSARGVGAVRATRCRQVHDEHVHRATRHERAGHRQRLVERCRFEDDQPFEADPAGDRLDRIEASGEVHVGHDRARRLRSGSQPQGEGRLAAGGVPPDGERGRARDPTLAEDGVQRGEAGGDDPIVLDDPSRLWVRSVRERDRGERAHHRPDGRPGTAECRSTDPWRGVSPTRLERRQGRRHVRGKGRHRTTHDRTDVLSRQEAAGAPRASCYTLAPVPGAAIRRRPVRPLVGM